MKNTQKKKKIKKHNLDNWPLRFSRGYLQYFKVKAFSTFLSDWSVKSIYWYNTLGWIFVLLILTDLIARECINDKFNDAYLMKAKKIDWGVFITMFLESILRMILNSPTMWKFLVKLNYIYDLIIAITTFIISNMTVTRHIGYIYYWLSTFQISRFYRVITTIDFVKRIWKIVLKVVLQFGAYYHFIFYLYF